MYTGNPHTQPSRRLQFPETVGNRHIQPFRCLLALSPFHSKQKHCTFHTSEQGVPASQAKFQAPKTTRRPLPVIRRTQWNTSHSSAALNLKHRRSLQEICCEVSSIIQAPRGTLLTHLSFTLHITRPAVTKTPPGPERSGEHHRGQIQVIELCRISLPLFGHESLDPDVCRWDS